MQHTEHNSRRCNTSSTTNPITHTAHAPTTPPLGRSEPTHTHITFTSLNIDFSDRICTDGRTSKNFATAGNARPLVAGLRKPWSDQKRSVHASATAEIVRKSALLRCNRRNAVCERRILQEADGSHFDGWLRVCECVECTHVCTALCVCVRVCMCVYRARVFIEHSVR